MQLSAFTSEYEVTSRVVVRWCLLLCDWLVYVVEVHSAVMTDGSVSRLKLTIKLTILAKNLDIFVADVSQ